jgi:isocitrate dehydrogenase
MFEAIHGSAPRRAGQNMANPSGLLQGAVLMLNHIGQTDVAEKVQNAWLKTIEDGIHTYDIYKEGVSTQKVGTREFAEAVIRNFGQRPSRLPSVAYNGNVKPNLPKYTRKKPAEKSLVGVDVFVHWSGTDPDELAGKLHKVDAGILSLDMITNRGIKVYPQGFPETFCTDHWRCRFKPDSGKLMTKADIIRLLKEADEKNIDVIKTENLYAFNGKPAFSLGQGQ